MGRPLAPLLGDGNRDGVCVDIETQVACNGFHGVVVSSYSQDDSERIPALRRDVLAARPTRATPIQMNGNHTASINPATPGPLWPVSHKV